MCIAFDAFDSSAYSLWFLHRIAIATLHHSHYRVVELVKRSERTHTIWIKCFIASHSTVFLLSIVTSLVAFSLIGDRWRTQSFPYAYLVLFFERKFYFWSQTKSSCKCGVFFSFLPRNRFAVRAFCDENKWSFQRRRSFPCNYVFSFGLMRQIVAKNPKLRSDLCLT